MTIIRVPKTPRKAFDPDRRPSSLLLKQIEHLEWAALPASQRKPGQLPSKKVATEGQAAERVAQLTSMVLEAKSKALVAGPDTLPPVVLPPLPARPRPSRPAGARPAKTRRAAARPASTRSAGKRPAGTKPSAARRRGRS